jgi:16S rRNA (cytosine1402-N4)-methyltransferase
LPFEHRPVMSREVVELLVPVPQGWVIDATVGGGGHSARILEAHPGVRVLGIDRDRVAVDAASRALAGFGERVQVVHGGFEHLNEIVQASGLSEGDIVGMLFDLGVSSPQLDVTERGFSYWSQAPLDMRMDNSQELTAETVVNTYGEDGLGDLIVASGEWRWGRRIAKAIVAARPLRTTGDLVDAIKTAIPAPARRKGGHPARRTFQAIRLEVNRELDHLELGLDESVHLLAPGGRALVLAYHSGEDRIVKQRFAAWSGSGAVEPYVPSHLPQPQTAQPVVRLLTRKPLRPSDAEVAANPRAESARLRAVQKIP